MEIKQYQQCCPNCKNTTFTASMINVKDFFRLRLSSKSKNNLIFQVLTCTKCGWKDHLLTEEGIKRSMDVALYIGSIANSERRKEILKRAGIPQMALVQGEEK